MTTVHQLKVTLRGIRPPIWRRIVVDTDTPLPEIAGLLEASMGWFGGHLHAFRVGTVTYQLGNLDDALIGHRIVDERTVTLGDVLAEPNAKMRWDYDFGDGWEHDVVAESISPAEAGVDTPTCLTGRRACPPEDCGGPWGYQNLLAASSDTDHPEHEELAEWLPEGFDPEAFDPAETTAVMRAERPLAPWDDVW